MGPHAGRTQETPLSRRTRTDRRLAAAGAAVLAALLAQPLLAPPARAGTLCGTPAAVGDCTAPDTAITQAPPVDDQSATASRDAAFAFEAEAAEGDEATFECQLQGPGQDGAWSDCTDAEQSKPGYSTGSKSYADLALGDYTFSVRATDTPDNPLDTANTEQDPATFSWTIVEPPPDTDAPETTITAGADRWWPYPFVGLTYSSDEDTSAWMCSLDGQDRTCDGDGRKGQFTVLHSKAGDHVFTVAAIDAAGNVDASPARERWTVPVNNTHFKKSKQWENRTGHGYFRNSYSVARERGAHLEQGKRRFRSLALVASRCPDCGKVAVFFKGHRIRTVKLSADDLAKRQIIPLVSWRKFHSGQVRLEVRSRGKDVIIEGIGFSRRR